MTTEDEYKPQEFTEAPQEEAYQYDGQDSYQDTYDPSKMTQPPKQGGGRSRRVLIIIGIIILIVIILKIVGVFSSRKHNTDQIAKIPAKQQTVKPASTTTNKPSVAQSSVSSLTSASNKEMTAKYNALEQHVDQLNMTISSQGASLANMMSFTNSLNNQIQKLDEKIAQLSAKQKERAAPVQSTTHSSAGKPLPYVQAITADGLRVYMMVGDQTKTFTIGSQVGDLGKIKKIDKATGDVTLDSGKIIHYGVS